MQILKDLDLLAEKLKTRLKLPLPGDEAHKPLRATPMGSLIPKFDHTVAAKPGSVLILLYPDEDKIRFPLIKRPDYLGAHSGQISFPGGKVEPGEDNVEAALREGEEEVGVRKESVNVIGRLSSFFVIPSNFLVVPVIGYVNQKPLFIPDPVEVVKIISGDIDALMHDDVVKEKEILAAGKYRMQAPHFEIEEEVVWGATAMMLNEFRLVLKSLDVE
jgi:8-oxo-dGTP pyrophosphatase MutT (NUDIX family)